MFFEDVSYVSIFLDESTTNAMQTRPVYCGLIGIQSNFDWLMCFAGQTNTAGCESGETYFQAVKNVFIMYNIWSKKKSIGTDGCHSMRSTSKYAGVNSHGLVGESFIAYVNRDIGLSNVLAFHSVLHIISLAVGDCVKKLPPFWIKHLQLIYTYFARSAKRKEHLKVCFAQSIRNLENLYTVFGELYEVHGWKLTYTKMYCKSRWTGIHTSCSAAISSWPALVSLKNNLIVLGYGYVQNEDGGSDDEGGDESVSSDDSNDSNSEDDMNWSDLFVADDTDIGNPLASKKKHDVLLDKERGITDTNWGLNSLMYGMLTPVTVCIERLQTTKEPI